MISFVIFGGGSNGIAASLENEGTITNAIKINVTILLAYFIVGPIDNPAKPYSIGKVALTNASFTVLALVSECLGGRVKPTVSPASGN